MIYKCTEFELLQILQIPRLELRKCVLALLIVHANFKEVRKVRISIACAIQQRFEGKLDQ